MTNQKNHNYIDVYEQVIDEDPEDCSMEGATETNHGLVASEHNEADYLEDIEEEAYDELYEQTKKAKENQSGGGLRTQQKRPLSQKLASSF